MVVFYDRGGAALLLEPHNYVLSFAMPQAKKKFCNFSFAVRMHRPDNDSQLLVPKGVQVAVMNEKPSSGYVSKYGIWNFAIADQWVAYPTNYTDGIVVATGNIDIGFTLEPVDPECGLHFYVKIDGSRSAMAIYVDKEIYGSYLAGICGNCNDLQDDYDRIPDHGALDDPIRIASGDYVKDQLAFPPDPDE